MASEGAQGDRLPQTDLLDGTASVDGNLAARVSEDSIPAESAVGNPVPDSGPAKKSSGIGNKVIGALIVLLFLFGAGVMLYPAYANLYFEYQAARAAAEYKASVDAANEQDMSEALEAAREYNRNHTVNSIGDPFSEPDETQDAEYNALMNPNRDGVMGYIEIPKISQKLVVYHGTSTEVLDKGVGHVRGSSLPVGGTSSHCVLSAHRGLPSAKLFTDLDQLKKGDYFVVHALGEHFAYEVEDVSVVKPEDVAGLAIQEGRDLMTLVTCTPYAVNTHRLLVRGHRTDYIPEPVNGPAQQLALFSPTTIAFACIMTLVVIAAIIIARRATRKKSQQDA